MMELLLAAQTALLLVIALALAYMILLLRNEVTRAGKVLADVKAKIENQQELEKRVAELEARQE